MQVKSADEIVRELREQGYRVSQSSVSSVGRYAPADAEWNYKDIPHLNYVHSQVGGVTFYTTDDASSSVFIQKFMGIRAIFCGALYQSSASAMTYLFTAAFFVVVVETSWRSVSDNETEVTTAYHIASPKVLRPVHKLLHGALARNYKLLMSEDLPMRFRRGDLRARGYGYRVDTEGVSFLQTLRTGRRNLVAPSASAVPTDLEVDLVALDDGEQFLGTDDFAGLRVHKAGTTVQCFPRFCPHDGAALDDRPIGVGGTIACPWHGRENGPLLSVDLSAEVDAESSGRTVSWGPNTITVESGRLSIRSNVEAPLSSDHED